MQHDEFRIGETFWCAGRPWRCTDTGRRTIAAIRLDPVDVESTSPELARTLNQAEPEAGGWFNGPPYAVAERVFDENDIAACANAPDGEAATTEPNLAEAITNRFAPLGGVELGETHADGSGEDTATRRAYVAAIREQVRLGGLRFEAYLPPDLAEWLLAKEGGLFTDPSEAVFAMLAEQRDLEPHGDLREELLRRCCQSSMDDPRPGIPHEEVMAWLQRQAEQTSRPKPAIWVKRRL
jgi:antitoxin ParD1/3/4